MDDVMTRGHIKKHADAVVRGDMDTVAADFSDELRPQLPQIASALPRPVTNAEVVGVEVGTNESVAVIRYSGDTGAIKVRSHWRELGGPHPVIVKAEPAD